MKKVRITIVDKGYNEALAEKHLTPESFASFGPCSHEVGETFLVGKPVMCPEGLCPWAWSDIESFVRIVAYDGQLEGARPPNTWVRCCTDAFRPVSFLIEPVEAGEEA
jgi:uncharacterized repeat protein (TIGR04076 family)